MLWMSKRCLLYIMIAQICLLYIMNVSKMSFVHYDRSNLFFVCYECLKDVFFSLWMSQRCYECLKDIFFTLWMSQRSLCYIMIAQICFLYVTNVSKMSSFSLWMSQRCYGCLKDVFCTLWLLKDIFFTLWMSPRSLCYIMIAQICFLYVMNVSKMSFFSLWMSQIMLWMSKRCLLYIMNVSKKSLLHYDRSNMFFVCYECLKDVFCSLWMSQRYSFWYSLKKMSFLNVIKDIHYVHYGCLKDVFHMCINVLRFPKDSSNLHSIKLRTVIW